MTDAGRTPAVTASQPKPVRVQIVEPTSSWALGLLNPNAFPAELKRDAFETAHQLGICAAACSQVSRSIPEPSQLLSSFVLDAGADVTPTSGKPLVLVYEATSFVGSLYGMLVTTKSVLDSLAKLITRALSPGEAIGGFNKAKVGDEGGVVGGKLLNWLEVQSERQGPNGDASADLRRVFKDHVDIWLGAAVTWRDDAAHRGGIKDLLPMQAFVSTSVRALTVNDVVGPFMPDGMPVSSYAANLLVNLADLIGTTIRLLPGVDVASLSKPTVPDNLVPNARGADRT